MTNKFFIVCMLFCLGLSCKQESQENHISKDTQKEQKTASLLVGIIENGQIPIQKSELHTYTDILIGGFTINSRNGLISTDSNDYELILDILRTNTTRSIMAIELNGYNANHEFLANALVTNTTVDAILKLLVNHKTSGICLIFNAVGTKDRDKYSSFILLLSKRIKELDAGLKLYVKVPFLDVNKPIDFMTVTTYVDQFLVLKHEQPEHQDYELSDAIDYYLASGIPSEKLTVVSAIK